jgi:serine protease
LDVHYFTPAGCSGVITVGATTKSGKRASYSNFGAGVDVAAPGGGIVQMNDGVSKDQPIYSTLGTGATYLTGYTFAGLDGTSMAAPQVAGLAALILSRNPSLSPDQVKSIIKSNTHPWGLGGLPIPDHAFGTGLIDVAKTVQAVP